MKVTVTEGRVVSDTTEDVIEACLDKVMEDLVRLGATDPAVGATLASREVEVSVVVEADTLDQAVAKGSAAIRSAIHFAGGGTPHWNIDWLHARTDQELIDA